MHTINDDGNVSESDRDLAVAQFLSLAQSANVSFELVEGRLVMRSSKLDWKRWAPIRHFLDELGVAAITEYFKRNDRHARASLSAAA